MTSTRLRPFIGSEREAICPQGILQGHRKQTIRRMKGRKRVLVIQDTTDLARVYRVSRDKLSYLLQVRWLMAVGLYDLRTASNA